MQRRTAQQIQRDEQILKHMGLVKQIANQYCKRHDLQTFEFDDLVQEGVIALMTALDTYRPEDGYTFGTYATRVIQTAITRAVINRDSAMPIPEGAAIKRMRLRRIRENLHTADGSWPSDQHIADTAAMPLSTVQYVQALPSPLLSLNRTIGHRGRVGTINHEVTLADVTPTANHGPEEIVGEHLTTSRLYEILQAHLTHKELLIIVLFFGLGPDQQAQTLPEIGKQLGGISRQAVSVIKNKALAKLRGLLGEQWREILVA